MANFNSKLLVYQRVIWKQFLSCLLGLVGIPDPLWVLALPSPSLKSSWSRGGLYPEGFLVVPYHHFLI